jgi:uncharacterized protein (TIGR02594 family)
MKYILTLLILLGACSGAMTLQKPQTLTHKAYFYTGLEEHKDRDLLKTILGVDPVNTEWCAAFVNMVLLQELLPTSHTVSEHPLMARSFLKWGDEVSEPKQGDIVVFKRGNSGWQGHVAFYVNTVIIEKVEYYNVIGGNQSDSVRIQLYLVKDVLSIRRAS